MCYRYIYRECVIGVYMDGYRGVGVSRVCRWKYYVYRVCMLRSWCVW